MIDKDIEIVKELVKKLKDTFKRIHHAIAIMPRIEEKDVLAIENALKELEIKDKMIDLMAIYLADMDFDDCCAEIPEPCFGCSWEDYEPHTNCIKEYFRKKAENDR